MEAQQLAAAWSNLARFFHKSRALSKLPKETTGRDIWTVIIGETVHFFHLEQIMVQTVNPFSFKSKMENIIDLLLDEPNLFLPGENDRTLFHCFEPLQPPQTFQDTQPEKYLDFQLRDVPAKVSNSQPQIFSFYSPSKVSKIIKKEKRFACEHCGKKFTTKSGLNSHLKTHTRIPNSFRCPYSDCEKRYSTAEGLRLHIRNHHTFDKKFQCPVINCSKKFVRQADLKLHFLRMHAAERPFPCTEQGCSKSFACRAELRRHMQSHMRKRKKLAASSINKKAKSL